ncbi:MAG: hypothetical protein LBC92_04705 [Rickettsiales bacterium]|jgi:hypothetical protein|nr:hypothetical protein [Rickettsiales bacterium]
MGDGVNGVNKIADSINDEIKRETLECFDIEKIGSLLDELERLIGEEKFKELKWDSVSPYIERVNGLIRFCEESKMIGEIESENKILDRASLYNNPEYLVNLKSFPRDNESAIRTFCDMFASDKINKERLLMQAKEIKKKKRAIKKEERKRLEHEAQLEKYYGLKNQIVSDMCVSGAIPLMLNEGHMLPPIGGVYDCEWELGGDSIMRQVSNDIELRNVVRIAPCFLRSVSASIDDLGFNNDISCLRLIKEYSLGIGKTIEDRLGSENIDPKIHADVMEREQKIIDSIILKCVENKIKSGINAESNIRESILANDLAGKFNTQSDIKNKGEEVVPFIKNIISASYKKGGTPSISQEKDIIDNIAVYACRGLGDKSPKKMMSNIESLLKYKSAFSSIPLKEQEERAAKVVDRISYILSISGEFNKRGIQVSKNVVEMLVSDIKKLYPGIEQRQQGDSGVSLSATRPS